MNDKAIQQKIRQDIFEIIGPVAPCPIFTTIIPNAVIDLGTLQIIQGQPHNYLDDEMRLDNNTFLSPAITVQGIKNFRNFVISHKPKIIYFVLVGDRILHNDELIRFHYISFVEHHPLVGQTFEQQNEAIIP